MSSRPSIAQRRHTKRRWEYQLEPGLAFTAYLPTDPARDAQRAAAFAQLQQEADAAWDKELAARPPRHTREPLRQEAQDRRQQDRSLGRFVDDDSPHPLHPMPWDVYLLTMALNLPELAPRVDHMRQAMERDKQKDIQTVNPEGSKPRSIGNQPVTNPPKTTPSATQCPGFSLTHWATGCYPAEDPRHESERALAGWIHYLADRTTPQGKAHAAAFFHHLPTYSTRTRWIIANWLLHPWWPQQDTPD